MATAVLYVFHMPKGVVVFLSALAVASVGSAQSLWVGAVTGTNQFSFTPGYISGEATDLGSTSQIAFYDHGSDSFTDLDLILGFVNPPASPPNITAVTVYTSVGNVDSHSNISTGSGTAHTGLNIAPSGPTQLNSGKVNAVLTGMPGISNSEQTSNYDAAETHAGITQTGGYALYAYNLNAFASSFSNGLLDIVFSSGIPKGTVAFGWGCGGSACGSDYTSVWTQSGFASRNGPLSSVPEPISATLLGTVSVLTIGLWRRKRQKFGA